MTDAALCRRAGLLIPLFSFPSSTSWGIGDIGDLVPMTAWLAAARPRVLPILPVNEMAPGQQSPYSAISAMAIDPIFLRLPDVPEFAAMGGEASLGGGGREPLGRGPRRRGAGPRSGGATGSGPGGSGGHRGSSTRACGG